MFVLTDEIIKISSVCEHLLTPSKQKLDMAKHPIFGFEILVLMNLGNSRF